MGMFDEITCYARPKLLGKYLGVEMQTKDTPCQFMDSYEIRKDGTLWHLSYDMIDTSDKTKKGWEGFIGCMTRVNERWEKTEFTGEIRFYKTLGKNNSGWIEFSSYFLKGRLQQLHKIEERNELC